MKNFIIKPKNAFLNEKNQQHILNKNINKDLNIEQKKKLCINILLNNHKDKLVEKVIKH